MAMAISISSTLPLPTATGTAHSSSFSSSNSLFFNTSHARKFHFLIRSSTTTDTSKGRRGLSCNCLFGLGVPELVVIAGVTALVFGPKKLPEVGRSIGKTVNSFRQAAKEFESELKKDPKPVGDSSAENVKAVSNEDEQDTKVSSSKES